DDESCIRQPSKSSRIHAPSHFGVDSDEEEETIFVVVEFVDSPSEFYIVPEKTYQLMLKIQYLVLQKNTELKLSKEKDKVSNEKDSVSGSIMDMETLIQPRPSSINISKINEATGISREAFENFKLEMDEKSKKQQNEYEKMFQELKKNYPLDTEKFVYQDTDLIKDVSGHPAHIWATNCCKILFTEDEYKNNVLVSSSKTKRETCSPTRVKMLREALAFKYKSFEKKEKIWKVVVIAFNTKGRGLKFAVQNSKELFRSKFGETSSF
ncbi:unnamed protein product, partial [Brachionus calyciflorus]